RGITLCLPSLLQGTAPTQIYPLSLHDALPICQAYTLATHAERHKIRRIEHFIGRSIPMDEIAGLEPQRKPQRGFGKRPGNGYRGAPAGGARREGQARPWHKPEWKSEGKPAGRSEWKPERRTQERTEWQPARSPEGRTEWKPERRTQERTEWQPGRSAEGKWKNDRRPQADGARRPGRPGTRPAERGAAPARSDRPQRSAARY